MIPIKVFDYVFLTRPVLFFPVWTVFLAGLIQAQMFGVGEANWRAFQNYLFDSGFWLAFLSLTLVMAASFIINQFTDMKSDRVNNKLFLLANGLVSKRAAVVETITILGLGLFLAAEQNLLFFVLVVALFLVTGVGYSLPPFTAKDRPVAGLLVNLVGGALTFLIGWQAGHPYLSATWVAAMPYILAIGAVYLLTTIADRNGDAAVGKRTFAVEYGVKRTIALALIMELAACLSAGIMKDLLILIPALSALPLFILAYSRGTIESTVVASRSAILFLCAAAVTCFPSYLVLLLAVFLISKWYYKARFDLNYPSLSPAVTRVETEASRNVV